MASTELSSSVLSSSVSRPSTSARWLAGALTGAVLAVAFAACGDDGGALEDGDDGSGPLGGCVLDGAECRTACDEGLGCVECLGDSDCGASAPACSHGRCRECGANTDCAEGEACFPKDGTCEPACQDDGDCDGDEEICDVDGGGACVGCLSADDCGDSGRPVCDPVRARCVECGDDLDCGASNPVCDEHEGECRECNIDADCPSGSACKDDHKCHDFCESDLDCGGDKAICRTGDGNCVECLADLDCGAATPFCNEQEKCVECIGDADCPLEAPACHDDKVCVECTTDAHCDDDAQPICKDRECVQCDKDDDCNDPDFPKCNKDRRECEAE